MDVGGGTPIDGRECVGFDDGGRVVYIKIKLTDDEWRAKWSLNLKITVGVRAFSIIPNLARKLVIQIFDNTFFNDPDEGLICLALPDSDPRLYWVRLCCSQFVDDVIYGRLKFRRVLIFDEIIRDKG